MEGQIGALTDLLKGMQVTMDQQHDSLQKTIEANTSVVHELSSWKPQVQSKVEDLQASVQDLRDKIEILSMSRVEAYPADKVFETEHIDLTGTATAHRAELRSGTSLGPLGHGVDHHYQGSGNGVVTTFIPTPVTGARATSPNAYVPYSLSGNFCDGSFNMNQALPYVEFPEFDGSSPKLWIKKCENYFDLYSVPDACRVKLAVMRFVGTAAFWLQSLEVSPTYLTWLDLCKAVSDRFERDQHHLLLRKFFHVKQLGSVSEYIEKFDDLVHQILAHDPKFNTATITSHFIDGLRDDIRTVVMVHTISVCTRANQQNAWYYTQQSQ